MSETKAAAGPLQHPDFPDQRFKRRWTAYETVYITALDIQGFVVDIILGGVNVRGESRTWSLVILSKTINNGANRLRFQMDFLGVHVTQEDVFELIKWVSPTLAEGNITPTRMR